MYNKNTRVYLRTGNRNTPEELADLEKIAWLQNQRRKSEELREGLYKRAEERFISVWSMLKIKPENYGSLGKPPSSPLPIKGLLTISLCPFYPKDPFSSPPDMGKIRSDIEVAHYRHHGDYFPRRADTESRIVQDGYVIARRPEASGVNLFHAEFNCFGLYFYKEWVITSGPAPNGNTKEIIRVSEILCLLDLFIQSATRFYQRLRYRGPLDFRVDLDNVRGCTLVWDHPLDRLPFHSPDSKVNFSRVILANELEKETTELILGPAQKICWAFGEDVTKKDLDNCLQRGRSHTG